MELRKLSAARLLPARALRAHGGIRRSARRNSAAAAQEQLRHAHNGARNVALRDGRGRANWVLPWDGNCYLTKTAWEDMVAAITAPPHFKYFVVPMARITDNACLLDSTRPEAKEEPQIVFRRDAREEFNESFPYGRRPKVELLWRLEVPGSRDRWGDDVWDPPRRGRSEEAGQFSYAGWVARLFSGQSHLEAAVKGTIRDRGVARMEAIRTTQTFSTRGLSGCASIPNDHCLRRSLHLMRCGLQRSKKARNSAS